MELLTHNMGLAGGIFPVNINSAGADGDWVNLKNYDRCTFHVLVGVQSGATTFTVEEASDVAGTGAAAMAFNYRVTPTNSDQFGALTAATSSGVATDGSTANVQYAIEIKANELTAGNSCLRIRASDPSANCTLSASAVMHGARYKQETMPTALT